MNIFKIAVYLFFVLCLCYLTFSLATDYQNNATRSHCSFVIWVIDTIDLFIHETGHLVFKLFGRFMEILGGSLFQVIIPLATVLCLQDHLCVHFHLHYIGRDKVWLMSLYILAMHLISACN